MPIPIWLTKELLVFASYVGPRLYSTFFGKKQKRIRKSLAYKVKEGEESLSYESSVPIIYGYNKVEGHIIYREQNSKRIFDLAVGLCEGEIEEIKNIKINDTPIDEIPTRSLIDTTISFEGNYIYDSGDRFDLIEFKKSGEDGTEDRRNYIIVKGSLHNDGAHIISDDDGAVKKGSIKTLSTFTNESAKEEITLSTSIGYRIYKGTSSQDGDDIFKKGILKLNPTEDTYVSEASPNDKFGSADTLRVRIPETGQTELWTFLKFDFSNLPAGLSFDEETKLKLSIYESGPSHPQEKELPRVGLYRATSESGWTEDDLTWNTKPTTGEQISNWSKIKGAGAIQEFDFNSNYGLPFLQAQYNSGGVATIIVRGKEVDTFAKRHEMYYSSKESVHEHAILEIHYSGGTPTGYRNTAYIALTFDAQEEKIGGSLPRVTAEVKGRLIKNWTGSEYVTIYNNNPIWCIRDLLTNTRYGIGISESDLDLDTFKIAAAYCDVQINGEDGDENRFECDVVLDDYADAYEAVQELLLTIRGRLFPLDGKIHIAIESSGSSDHTFTEDNILPDSFSYFEADKNEIPNTIRVLYTNASKDFKLDYVQVEDEIDLETRDRVIDEIQCYSINRRSQATRLAYFLLWKARHCNKACTFGVSINNCDVAVNDICRITHSVPNWTLKYFRIVQISESFRDEIELVCEEYDADIYYDGGTLPTVYNETPNLPPAGERPPFVTSLNLAETHEILDDGTYIPQIIVTFVEPNYVYPLHYWIWKMKEGEKWKPYKLISTNTCIISVDEVAVYYIKVQSLAMYSDCESDFDDSPQSSISMVGQSETPSIPTVAGIDWSTDSKAKWTTGRIYHKGTAYNIASGNTTDAYIYFEPSTSETTLQHSNTRPTMNADTWIMAVYDSDADEITLAQGFKLLHAAILQAHTITAVEILGKSLTINEITISATDIGVEEGADVTVNNPQAYGWLTGAKPPVDADVTLSELEGSLSLTGGGLILSSGGATIESGNFEHGVAGWRIYYDGSAEFQNAYIRGTVITAVSGKRAVMDGADGIYYVYNTDGHEIVRLGYAIEEGYLRIQDYPANDITTIGSGSVIIQANSVGTRFLMKFDTVSKMSIDSDGDIWTAKDVDVDGNIICAGTVDGRDIDADGTKLDGIDSGANNYTHPTTGSCPQNPKSHTTFSHSDFPGSPGDGNYLRYDPAEGGLYWSAT